MVEGNAYEKNFPKKRSLPRTLTEASEWLEKSKAGRALVRRCLRRTLRRQPRMGRPRVPPRHHRLGAGALLRDHLMNSPREPIPEDHQPRGWAACTSSGRSPTHGADQRDCLRTARHAFRRPGATLAAERAAVLTRFCAEFEKRGAQIAEELTWQMGRPGALRAQRSARHAGARAAHDRHRARGAGGRRRRRQGQLPALRAARAAGRGVHRRRLELPVSSSR